MPARLKNLLAARPSWLQSIPSLHPGCDAWQSSSIAPPLLKPVCRRPRIVDGLIAPSKTYHDILRSTAWWLPYLLSCLMTLAFAYTVDRKVTFEQVAQTSLHQTPAQEEQIQQLPPADRANALRRIAVVNRYVVYGYPVMSLVFGALCALVLWGTVNFALGASTTFGQMLCLWMYAQLPRLFTGLLTIIALTVGDNAESFNVQNPVGTNPGYYLSDAAPWLRTALSFFDVIGLWTVFLLILGIAIIGKVRKGQAAAVVLTWWVLVLIASIAGSALSS